LKIDEKAYTVVMVDEVVEETASGYIDQGAILVRIGERSEWLAKKELEDWPDVGDGGEVLVAEWLAVRKGFV